ncbi:MAG TPA: hypothetical protein VL240_06605 [Candidatus Binatia bacterium]|nr:hypothetical protein [Candidatus Binatia bacterium]
MSVSLRAVLPDLSPMNVLAALPTCANRYCPRPATLWQRWWARHEGIRLQELWYCSPQCFQIALLHRLERVSLAAPVRPARPNRLPLGLVLLAQGEITSRQLREALEAQKAAHSGRLGEWLVTMGVIGEQQVTAALAVQQGCPTFPVREPQSVRARMYWPDALVRRYGAVPVFHNEAQCRLYVGFLEGVDHGFLYSLEQMLRCRTEPCIVAPATHRRQLELRALAGAGDTIEIRQRQSAVEMTRTIGNYAQQVRAATSAPVMTACGRGWNPLTDLLSTFSSGCLQLPDGDRMRLSATAPRVAPGFRDIMAAACPELRQDRFDVSTDQRAAMPRARDAGEDFGFGPGREP